MLGARTRGAVRRRACPVHCLIFIGCPRRISMRQSSSWLVSGNRPIADPRINYSGQTEVYKQKKFKLRSDWHIVIKNRVVQKNWEGMNPSPSSNRSQALRSVICGITQAHRAYISRVVHGHISRPSCRGITSTSRTYSALRKHLISPGAVVADVNSPNSSFRDSKQATWVSSYRTSW